MVVLKEFVIGTKEILKAIKAGKIESVMMAANCPDFLAEKIKSTGTQIEDFSGDQQQLGNRVGKPFPIAMAGRLKKQ